MVVVAIFFLSGAIFVFLGAEDEASRLVEVAQGTIVEAYEAESARGVECHYRYEYSVDGVRYYRSDSQEYRRAPSSDSACKEKVAGAAVTVYYSPVDPERSDLDNPRSWFRRYVPTGWLLCIGLLAGGSAVGLLREKREAKRALAKKWLASSGRRSSDDGGGPRRPLRTLTKSWYLQWVAGWVMILAFGFGGLSFWATSCRLLEIFFPWFGSIPSWALLFAIIWGVVLLEGRLGAPLSWLIGAFLAPLVMVMPFLVRLAYGSWDTTVYIPGRYTRGVTVELATAATWALWSGVAVIVVSLTAFTFHSLLLREDARALGHAQD